MTLFWILFVAEGFGKYNRLSIYGGTRCVMVIVVGKGHGARIQIVDEADYISHSTNALRKGMNPIILPPDMCK